MPEIFSGKQLHRYGILVYNIHIMEEDQSIFAFGAGGGTKVCQNDIIRSFNVKSVEDYMKRSEEMAQRKLKLI